MNEELLKQHSNLIELVKNGVLIAGKIDRIGDGVVYSPITIDEFLLKIENNDIADLGYNTKTMGRGIFTVDISGSIINYKGVDSHLKDEDNIAVQETNSGVYDVSEMIGVSQNSPYKIAVMIAEEQEPEIRVRGASQFQNLLNEKEKSDALREKDKKGLIRFPEITEIRALCDEICEKFHLPQNVKIDENFIEKLEQNDKELRSKGKMGNYALYCLKYMQSIGLSIESRNQTWKEYFSSLSEEEQKVIGSIPEIDKAIEHQDKNYELGAMFGQATRVLDTPFRIMELDYYSKNNQLAETQAILNYENNKRDGKFLEYYAKTTAKDLAGLMNNNISIVNWLHRQDYSLSGELCDDAYDDISSELENYKGLKDGTIKDINSNKAYWCADRFYGQIYLFATNMKIIENAYQLSGLKVPENYQEIFFENLIDNIDDKQKFIQEISERSEPLSFLHKNRERQMFEGYEKYIDDFRRKMLDKFKELHFEEQNSQQVHVNNRNTDEKEKRMENYTSTYNTIKQVYREVNEKSINAYMIGGISSAIQAGIDLYRQNEDIDLMVAKEDLPQLIESLQKIGYQVQDKRANLTENYVDEKGIFHPMDHELNADINSNDMLGVGIFVFERKDGVVITNSYAYEEKEKAVIGTQSVMPEELFDLMYSSENIDYKGMQVKCQTKEYTYLSKAKGTREKDKIDADVIKQYIGTEEQEKIKRIEKLQKRVTKYRVMYDKDGNIISSEKMPSMEDKIVKFISDICEKNEGKSVEEIKQIISDNKLVQQMIESNEDIRDIMTQLNQTQIDGNIAETAKTIAHDYYFSDEPLESGKITKSTQQLGRETLEEQRNTRFLDKIEEEQSRQAKAIIQQKENQENRQSIGE